MVNTQRERSMGYSFQWAIRVLLYAPSQRQDSSYQSWSTGWNDKCPGFFLIKIFSTLNITVIKICCVWLNNDINKQLLFKHISKMEAYFILSHMKLPSFTLILLRTHRPFWRFTTTCSFSKSVTTTPPQSLSMLRSAIKTNKQLFMVHIWIIQKQNNSIKGRKEGNVLFNDTLNTFYLRLYGIGHMVKDHSDSERGN